jgi:16S rRNA processing protein RimM
VQEVVLGKIVGVFGVKGWLRIKSYTEPVLNIFQYNSWKLELPDSSSCDVVLESGRLNGNGLIARFGSYSDRNKASSLVGAKIRIPVDKLPELGDDDYYWYQLETLAVVNVQNIYLGDISHLLATGANDVLVVKPGSGSIDDRERLIPYLPGKTVMDVQLEEKRMLVDWDSNY